jgi:uncharacterized protein (TIRG00374 family)
LVRFSTLVRLLIAVGLTAWVVWRADVSNVASAFARTSWAWVAAASALVLVDRLLMAYRWIALLAVLRERRPSFLALTRIFFVSTFLGTFLVQTVGSDAVRTWSLSREGVPASESLASVLMDRLLGIISILLAAAMGLAFVPTVVRESPVVWAFAITTLACGAAIVFVFSTTVDEWVRGMLSRVPAGRFRTVIGRLLDALQAYRAHHGMLAGVLVASLGVQLLRILQAWLLGRALGIGAPLASYFAFIPLILLVMLLPVTFNGLGTSQLAFVWAFGRVGVPDADGLALSVLFVALGILGNIPGGLLYVFGRERFQVASAPPPTAR